MRRIFPYLLLIPAFVTGVLWWKADQGHRAALDRVAQLEAARSAGGANSPAPASVEETGGVPQHSSTEPRVVRIPTGTDPAPYLKAIDELREQNLTMAKELSAARDSIARLENGAAEAAAEGKKLKAQLDDMREDVQAARRLSDALQAELRAKSERLVKVETSENLLQERVARAEASATKVSAAAKEIDDLNRRREAYLTTLLRRFREVNDLYRNFTLNVQTHEGAAPGLQAGDLSRIQSAIQQGEDDLRQVQSLNARMAQLARSK
jgi:chromosome segregation ATPase